VALGWHHLVMEGGTEVADSESSSEEHGEEPVGNVRTKCYEPGRQPRRDLPT
jgi:hypothetical protein